MAFYLPIDLSLTYTLQTPTSVTVSGLEIRGFDIGPAHGQESRPLPGSYPDHSFFYAGTKIQFWGHFSSTDKLWYNRNTQDLKPQSVASYFWGLSILLRKMGGKFSPDLKELEESK